MDDGTRTHDDRHHKPGLYQLSYAHHCVKIISRLKPLLQYQYYLTKLLARPAGLEPATLGLAYQLPISRPRKNCRFVVWTISSPSQVPHV